MFQKNEETRKPHLVVVGNGPVGFHFLRSLTRSPQFQRFRLTVFGEEPVPAYDRIHLSDCFSSKSVNDLIYAPQEWYREQGIELHTNDPVVAIDRQKRLVRTRSDVICPYDKLLLSTGSIPFVPPISGIELPGVFVYRTLQDVEKIREFATGCHTGIVVGGGLLGLEAAKGLRQLGLTEVHIVESTPFLMSRQLDKQGSQTLRAHVEALGFRVHTHWSIDSISTVNRQLQVRVQNGLTLETQIVVIASGIRPRDELAVDCGLRVATRGGVVVNDNMQTSDPFIYACGECAAHRGVVYGLLAPGFQMAEVAADQLTGGEGAKRLTFSYGDLSTELKLMEIDVATLGESQNPRSGFHEVVYRDSQVYRKLTFLGGRIVGGMYVGNWEQKQRLRDAIDKNQYIWQWQIQRFLKSGNLWQSGGQRSVLDWSDNSIICNCTSTRKGEILAQVATGDATLASVQLATGAASVCGACHPLVAELCGAKVDTVPRRQNSLAWASALTVVGVLLLLGLGPHPVPTSVQHPQFFDALLTDHVYKQFTGYSLLGLTSLSMLFSLRKRLRCFTWGDLITWRAAHAWLAGFTLVGLYFHTGFRHGSHLNFALFLMFSISIGLGACTGLVTAMETNSSGKLRESCRTIRPWVTWIHLLGTWILPVLILFHILAAYSFQ